MVPLSPRVCQKQSPGAGITPVSERLQFSRLDGYLVWQADADNPGSWPFHCHIAWHASTGSSWDILEQPNQIQNLNIPDPSSQLCQDLAGLFGHGRGRSDRCGLVEGDGFARFSLDRQSDYNSAQGPLDRPETADMATRQTADRLCPSGRRLYIADIAVTADG